MITSNIIIYIYTPNYIYIYKINILSLSYSLYYDVIHQWSSPPFVFNNVFIQILILCVFKYLYLLQDYVFQAIEYYPKYIQFYKSETSRIAISIYKLQHFLKKEKEKRRCFAE